MTVIFELNPPLYQHLIDKFMMLPLTHDWAYALWTILTIPCHCLLDYRSCCIPIFVVKVTVWHLYLPSSTFIMFRSLLLSVSLMLIQFLPLNTCNQGIWWWINTKVLFSFCNQNGIHLERFCSVAPSFLDPPLKELIHPCIHPLLHPCVYTCALK